MFTNSVGFAFDDIYGIYIEDNYTYKPTSPACRCIDLVNGRPPMCLPRALILRVMMFDSIGTEDNYTFRPTSHACRSIDLVIGRPANSSNRVLFLREMMSENHPSILLELNIDLSILLLADRFCVSIL